MTDEHDHDHEDDRDDGGAEPARHVVVQRLDGFPAVLRRLRDGTLVLEGRDGEPLPSLAPGERIRVTHPVTGDATYAQSARVLRVEADAEGRGHADIRTNDETLREQQRRFARVATQPIDVVLVAPGDGQEAAAELRDVSAGGARTVLDGEPFEVGSVLHVHMELPRGVRPPLDLDLAGEVVWTGQLDDGRSAAGIEFAEADRATESRLVQWVFQQQTRRG